MDLEVTDVSTQARPEQMDEGFTTTVYPKVQENLKLTVEEHVILEEPASSTWTLSSLQHLTKDLNFGDLFFNDKPSKADNEKITIETKAELMVSFTIQQDTSSIPPMTTPVSKAVDEIVTDAVDWAIQAPLQNCFRDLPEVDMKEILHQRMWETNSYKTHKDHMMLYEALEKSMNRDYFEELLKDLAEAHKKKKKTRDSPKMPRGSPPHQPPPPPPPAGPSRASGSPGASGSSQVPPPPPPPPSTNQEGQSHGSIAPSSSKTVASAEYKAWTTTDTRLGMSVSSTSEELQIDDDMAPDAQARSSDDEDIGNANIPKGSRPALSISKMKAAYYPDVGLKQMVPNQMWIDEECKYDIAAMYGDGEDDCCVFEVDVTGSGYLGVWVDVSMGSKVVSRFWVRLFRRLCSSFSSFLKEIACSFREAI
nr:hypothetical protein [Tanacetum cinerariifolium]